MFSACQNQVVWVTNNQCEPVSHRVLGLGVKKINKEDSCICRGFVLIKPWVFLLPTFVSIWRFLWTVQFSFAYVATQQFFLIFYFEILHGKLAHNWPKMIPSHKPDIWPLCYIHHCQGATSQSVQSTKPTVTRPCSYPCFLSVYWLPLCFCCCCCCCFFCLAKLIFCCLFPVAVNLHLLDAKNYSIWL